ncbi:MAG: hypothetical protein ACE5F7_07340 [Nitrospiria bacterium]
MMRILVICMWTIAFFVAPLSPRPALSDEYGRTGSLIVFIKANKPRYEIGEPIHITVTLSNHTTVPLIINKRLNPLLDLEWELFAENLGGHLTMKVVPPRPLTPEDFVRLEVNEEFGKQFDDLTMLVNGPLKEGRYAIRLTYRNKEKPQGDETWTGTAVTNLLWIEVKSTKKI